MNYIETITNAMYPIMHNHMFGVNGKISGSISAAGEIEGVIPIIHGPKGCTFYYRYSARRRHEPFYNIYSSDLKEEDIIFGGTEKLKKTVEYVYNKHKPNLIMIISSTVSDVLNEDIESVIYEYEGKIPVIQVKSELFSHRDKNFGRKRLKELSNQSVKKEENIGVELKGCGYSEFLVSLVDNFMEKDEVIKNSVNIETIGWGRDVSETVGEIEKFLNNSGIKVISRIPSDSYENLKSAPNASLNLAKRIRWAKEMEDKFNTPFLHINSGNRYGGLEGVENFYKDIYKALGNDDNNLLINLEYEKNKVIEETKEDLEKLSQYNVLLYSRSIGMLPAQIKKYRETYKLNIPYIVLEITDVNIKNMNVDEETLNKLLERVEESISTYSKGSKFLINPKKEEIDEIKNEVTCIIGSTNPTLEKYNIPVIASNTDEASYTFESYKRSVKRLLRRIESNKNKPNLLLNLLDFDKSYYPLVDNKNNIASRKMWMDMWLNKED